MAAGIWSAVTLTAIGATYSKGKFTRYLGDKPSRQYLSNSAREQRKLYDPKVQGEWLWMCGMKGD